MDQRRYIVETWDHESVDSKMIKLFSLVCAFFAKEGHAIMDCPFVPFHIRVGVAKQVELQDVAGTLMDQPQEQESRFLIVKNKFHGMELGNQLGPQS